MHDLLRKLAEAAAQATGPAAQAQGAQAAPMDPNDPNAMMAPPPDPIEMDNQRLTNILTNLQLRQQVAEAQQALEEAQRPVSRRRSSTDPDQPRKSSRDRKPDVTTATSITEMVKNTPRSKRRAMLSGIGPKEDEKKLVTESTPARDSASTGEPNND